MENVENMSRDELLAEVKDFLATATPEDILALLNQIGTKKPL